MEGKATRAVMAGTFTVETGMAGDATVVTATVETGMVGDDMDRADTGGEGVAGAEEVRTTCKTPSRAPPGWIATG